MPKRRIVIDMPEEDYQAFCRLVQDDHFASHDLPNKRGPYVLSMIQSWVSFRDIMATAGVPYVAFQDIISHCKKDPSWLQKVA